MGKDDKSNAKFYFSAVLQQISCHLVCCLCFVFKLTYTGRKYVCLDMCTLIRPLKEEAVAYRKL